MSRVRLRARAGGLLFGAGVVFLMGTNAQAGWLLVIAALLVGAVLAGVVLPLVGVRGLSVELTAPDEATQGDAVTVDVAVTGAGRGVRWGLRVLDDHLQPTRAFVDAIRAGERVEVTTERVPRRRGVARTTHVEFRTAAPFGVAERRRRVAVDAATLVLPAVVPLGPLPFVDPIGTAEPAIHSALRRGHGPEYLGIREYRTGDPMRHVHWASTARHGAVMVREFEEERTRRLLIVIDTEGDADVRGDADAPTPLDRCCTAAASLATSAFAHGHGARLVAATPVGIDVVARTNEDELLRRLAELVPTGVPIGEVVTGIPSDAVRGVETVVLVAPAWPDAGSTLAGASFTGSPMMADPLPDGSLVDAVEALGGSVPRVVCVLVTVEEGDAVAGGVGAALVAAGAEVYPWPLGGDLAAILGATP